MAVRQFPWTDIRSASRLVRHSWRRHRAAGARLADFTLTSGWLAGRSSQAVGPFMFSVTQFTPKHSADLPDIWLASAKLAAQLVRLDGSVGVLTYLRPARGRQVGSLSVWIDDSALSAFIALPDHIEIMNKYRPRGLPVRSATWWSDSLDTDAAITEGLRLLDSDDTRRIALPRRHPGCPVVDDLS